MEQFLLQNRSSVLFIAGITALAVISAIGVQFVAPKLALAQDDVTEDVVVTATVEGYLAMTVTPTTTSLTPALVQSDGTENIGTSDTLNIDVSTNVASGYSLTIHGLNGGLDSAGATHTISTVTSTTTATTLVAGTEGYGTQVSTVDSGTVETPYDSTSGASENVGPIFAGSGNAELVLSTASAGDNHSSTMLIKAAANKTSTPPATDYTDTATLTATVSL